MNELIDFIQKQMSQNEFAIAGVMVTALSTAIYQMKAFPLMGWNLIKRKLVYTITLNEDDEIYAYFNKWLSDKYSKHFRNVKFKTENTYDDNTYEVTNSKFSLEQYQDHFFFWHKGNPIMLNKIVETLDGAYDHASYEMGKFELSILWNKGTLNKLLNTIFKDYKTHLKKENKLRIFTTGHHDWEEFRIIKPVVLDKVVLDKQVKSTIVESISKWKKDKLKLEELGISSSLIHLYDGAPGSGKTTTLMALAYENNMSVYYLNLNSITSVISLNKFVRTLPDNSMLVIEELEDIWDGRKQKDDSCKIPISAFLNILSGTLSKDGLMIVMTSNDVSKLDPALIRPGRVDLRVTFTKPDFDMTMQYINSFYSNGEWKILNEEVKWLPESMAELENECLKNVNNCEPIINKIKGVGTNKTG